MANMKTVSLLDAVIRKEVDDRRADVKTAITKIDDASVGLYQIFQELEQRIAALERGGVPRSNG